jgi:hypothetical protein
MPEVEIEGRDRKPESARRGSMKERSGALSARSAALVASLLLLLACATTPQIEPTFAEIGWHDFGRGTSAILVTRGFEDYERRQQSGRLPPEIKLVDPDAMGVMKRVLEDYGFFDRAVNASPDAPGLAETVPQVIYYRDGARTLTMQYLPDPAGDPERMAWDKDFVTIKNGLLDIHRNTFSLTVDPSRSGRRAR